MGIINVHRENCWIGELVGYYLIRGEIECGQLNGVRGKSKRVILHPRTHTNFGARI